MVLGRRCPERGPEEWAKCNRCPFDLLAGAGSLTRGCGCTIGLGTGNHEPGAKLSDQFGGVEIVLEKAQFFGGGARDFGGRRYEGCIFSMGALARSIGCSDLNTASRVPDTWRDEAGKNKAVSCCMEAC